MRYLPFAMLLLAAGLTTAQESPDPAMMSEADMEAAYRNHVEKTLAGLHYHEVSAELPGGFTRLELPSGYRFLDADDARRIVVDLWRNPPASASDVLGMVVPAGEDLAAPDSWAIVLEFAEDGYVSDKDADDIDYDVLLEQLKEGSRQANTQREAEGYGPMVLTGWAVAPHYDKTHKVLHWAKRFDVGTEVDALNYDVRVLGRRGVLSLNGVADMTRVADIEAATPAIVSMVHFNDGHAYADFDPATDKEADYSLAGLVVGGAVAAKLAAKVGLLAKLGALLLAGKKFVILGVIGLAVLGKKLFGRKTAA